LASDHRRQYRQHQHRPPYTLCISSRAGASTVNKHSENLLYRMCQRVPGTAM
jgi:hypothetical protein